MNKPFVMIEYKTADGSRICVEVSTSVKELLEQSDRQIRSQRRQDRRHLNFAIRTDGDLDSPLLPAHVDTAVLVERRARDAQLYRAISQLPEIQRRRLILHFIDNLAYRQIAEMEGVNQSTVGYSIKRSLKQLSRYLAD